MRIFPAAALLALGLLVALPVRANPDFDLGPAVGQAAPAIGTPVDQSGRPRALASLMGEKGMVLFFFRSAAWCPYCKAQLIDLNGGLAQITKRGFRMAGISYDATKVQADFTAERGIKFPLLSDPKSDIIDRYKLRDPQYATTSMAYGVPRPIIFVLDRNGVIKAKLYEETYKSRPPLALVLETLDKAARN